MPVRESNLRRTIAAISGFPFYLWALGGHPALHLYAENLGLVFDQEVIAVIALVLAATTIAFLVTNLGIRNRHKTAFLVGVCSLFFSLAGHVYDVLLLTIPFETWTTIVLIALGLILLVLHTKGSARVFEQVSFSINVVVFALLIFPTVTVAAHLLSQPDLALISDPNGKSYTTVLSIPKTMDSPTHPDIYYIIPDGYPSDSWLQNEMNYDNSDFSRALESRGFVVADHAQSNYGATLLSIASVMNMQFYDTNESALGDLEYLRLSIADNKIARHLLKRGYTYIQFLSGYLLPSPIADINLDFGPTGPIKIEFDWSDMSRMRITDPRGNEFNDNDIRRFYKQSFISLYLESTPLRILTSDIVAQIRRGNIAPYTLYDRDRFMDTINEIERIVAMPEATFSIIHLMKPHLPTVFDAQGDTVSANWFPSHEQYFDEFSFTNSVFIQMIDTILDASENQPIILFQADHGSTYGAVWTAEERLTHFDAYAAYFLPDRWPISFPGRFTLINSFPLIFNEVFDTDLVVRSNQLFDLPFGYDAPFEQLDVTDDFAHRP